MLLDGVPVALKYKMDRVWHRISQAQKDNFYESYRAVPYWWTSVKIDPVHGERIYA